MEKKKVKREIKQGDIYIADLGNNDGSVQSFVHPVLVISLDIANRTSPNVVVLSITHQKKKEQPTHYKLFKKDYDFFKYEINTVLGEAVTTLSKDKLERYMGRISNKDFQNVIESFEYIHKYLDK